MKRGWKVVLSLVLLVIISGVFSGIDANASTVPLSSKSQGSEIQFAGKTWIVLNPSTGFLYMKDNLITRPYEEDWAGGSNAGHFRIMPSSNKNIGYYLNYTYLSSLTGEEQSVLDNHDWECIGYDYNCEEGKTRAAYTETGKVALISENEWRLYSKKLNSISGFLDASPEGVWTRTFGHVSGSERIYYATSTGVIGSMAPGVSSIGIHPVVYMNVNTLITDTGSVTTDKEITTGPTISLSKMDYTNSDVTATLVDPYTSEPVRMREYRKDGGAWLPYIGPLTLSSNATIEARVGNEVGYSPSEMVTVSNIDKVKPGLSLSLGIVVSTNNGIPVFITAVDSQSGVLMTTMNDGTGEVPVFSRFTASKNGKYIVTTTDRAGNKVSKNITVNGINRVMSSAPTYVLSETGQTVKDVSVAVNYAMDTVKKEYSLDGVTWLTYTKPVVFNSNGVLKARSVDNFGNLSAESSLDVNNIVKSVPNTPSITISTTSLTNSNVGVVLTGDATSNKVQYKTSNGVWEDYTTTVEITHNTLLKARSIGDGGSVSKEKLVRLSNIDKEPPTFILTGVRDNGVYTGLIKPKLAIHDDSKTNVEYRVDGKPYFIGVTLEKGTYSLEVIVKDMAGNKATEGLNFTIR